MARFAGISTAVVVLVVLLASACGDSSSGIEGIAVSSGGPSPGDPHPIANTRVLVHEDDGDGRVVGSVFTDAEGRFKLDVGPGTYTLVLITSGGYPVRGTAQVTSGQYAQVELTLPIR